MAGTLYVVATPIGNLEDITLRALRVLGAVDLIACEDTRQTAKLLAHYQIQKPTTSYHEHNEVEKAAELIGQLEAGKNIALVSDAGTPGIADPGYRIVRRAHQHHIRVVPIPGPCSVVAALSASGRPTNAFAFLGFLPARPSARERLLAAVQEEPRTLIFFESPERLVESLASIGNAFGQRSMTVARELTKIHEELFFGTPHEAAVHFSRKKVRGEVLLIIEPAERNTVSLDSLDKQAVRRRFQELTRSQGASRTEVIKQLARSLQVSRRELYRLLAEDEEEAEPET